VKVATADHMRALGRALGDALRTVSGGALVIGIEGELGAGKTTLVGGILAALGVTGAIRSPTYTLIEPYEAAGLQLYHIDLYRLSSAREVEALGIRDLLDARAVLLIEWPSRGAGALPTEDLRIKVAIFII
jgi:tRNA threonylcarbamoyladenosine biosynthesis protein TsaE